MRDEDAVVLRLRQLGGDPLIDRWLAENEVDAAAAFMQALFNFATRVLQLRSAKPNFSSWNEIYVGQEVAIHDALVYSGASSVFVSGAIDSLRIHPAGEMEIVDYKLSHGRELEKELVQIAIYQHLLRLKKPEFACRGCIEYLLPKLHVQKFTADELAEIYRKWVEPVFPLLTARPASRSLTKSLVKPPPAPSFATASGPLSKKVAAPAPQAGMISLGRNRADQSRVVESPLAALTRHTAIVGSSGSGKTTLALGLVEQTLLQGISVVLVDRKGDLCRYADPAAWDEPVSDPEIAARRTQLRGKFEVALFTPGHNGGRPLGIRVIPAAQKDAEENDLACRAAAHALGGILGLSLRPSDQPKIAILTSVIRVLCATFEHEEQTLDDMIVALGDPSEELRQAIGPFDPKHVRRLVEAIQTLKILQGDLLGPQRENLDASAFFPRSKRPRLTIIATKFLDQKSATQFWLTQFLIELGKFTASHPSPTLQGLVMMDEADLYLPAVSRPPTKAPMENLLRRARSAGLGILLATQSPGDFDYKCKENVLTWLVGLVKEKTALEKMRPMFSDEQAGPFEAISRQRTGQFLLLQEGSVMPFAAPKSALETVQLSDQAILKLAREIR